MKEFEVEVNGVTLLLRDINERALGIIVRELRDNVYGLEDITFEPGDNVIDIGAHVGIISCYLAKKYPFINIYAFEPHPKNFEYFIKNIRVNGCENINAQNLAVTANGRDFFLSANYEDNSGGATGCIADLNMPGQEVRKVKSTTIDKIFASIRPEGVPSYGTKVCKLLKIDCEGAEHEILMNFLRLDVVDYLVGEFHINKYLTELDTEYSLQKLIDHCDKSLETNHLKVNCIRMAE